VTERRVQIFLLTYNFPWKIDSGSKLYPDVLRSFSVFFPYLHMSLTIVAAGFGVRPTEHRVLRGMVTFAVVHCDVELK